ncbi:sigma-70 family RNA polymerase sigma factor [Caulobacter sp.]|uniref:RNA polymerase sigma factor n=1 Tax=Caulobacter sp. TaxID=78 RepID=UPI002B47B011|nr:sigma-70 family RNA polymerase sigma factor [Caulobacter sp.]HJV43557.1 sigma-70 family RNA polymerase sigma factor [Caulobacter sp.]
MTKGDDDAEEGPAKRPPNYWLGRYGVEIRTALTRRFGPDQDGVDDAIQSALLKFCRLDDREAIADPRAFLFVMARNALRDSIRRANSQKRRWAALSATPFLAPPELTPEEVLMQQERQKALESALEGLAPEARELLRLSRIEGLTYAEISRMTGRSAADISRKIAAVLIELRERLRAVGAEAA